MICIASPLWSQGATRERRADVAERSTQVMPFSLAATTHIFTKTESGGVQRVVAKRVSDTAQTIAVRQHLRALREKFVRGDFSDPTTIHGPAMPGVAALSAAKRGALIVRYREVPGGAELTYRSSDASLVAAVHEWFDAQLADHGDDAMAGHAMHHPDMQHP
jgi:hypothetical protein